VPLSTRLVREKAWIKPWCLRFLSTYRVLRYLLSKPVSSMSTTMVMSIFCAGKALAVGIGPLLVFDALLHVLVVQVELADAVVGAVAGVVVGQDGFEGGLLALGVDLVVCLFLRQVFLNLRTSASPSAGGENTQAMLSGLKSGSAACLACLHGLVNRRGIRWRR
jgi:hypothetical protein